MDPSIIVALIGVVSAVIGIGASLSSNERNNEANANLNQKNLDYNTAMTQQNWERDDTAHQREVADLKAAGLSPLAATGGLSTSAPLGAPNPIAMQAPQIDTSSLINSVLESANLSETSRHNKAEENLRETEIGVEAKKVSLQAKSLDIENKKVEEQVRYQTELNRLASENLEEVIRSHKKDEDLRLSAQESLDLERESQRYALEIQKATGGAKIPVKNVYDIRSYELEMKLRSNKLSQLINELQETQSAAASSKGGNATGSAAGTGLGIGVNVSEYRSSDISQKQQAIIDKFNQENPLPVYIDKSQYKYLFKD